MSALLQDIWHDLREKRLWPVAALLLLAVVAVPAVLAKSAVEPEPQPPVEVNPETEAADLDIEVADGGPGTGGRGSSLDSFKSRNPFRPPGSIGQSKQATSAETAAGPSDGEAKADGGSGDTGGSPPSSDQPAPPPTPVEPPKTVNYEYVVDLTFWNGSKRRQVKGMSKLGMLPSEAAPLLILMGVGPGGNNATFMVDSTLDTRGEGRCTPTRADCAFLYLGPGSEQVFTNDEGRSYGLRIDEIRKVEIRTGRTVSRPRGPANAAVGTKPAPRRFNLPFLADVIESTGVEQGSSTSPDGR